MKVLDCYNFYEDVETKHMQVVYLSYVKKRQIKLSQCIQNTLYQLLETI